MKFIQNLLRVRRKTLICVTFFYFSEFYCLSIGAKHSGAVLGEVVMEGNVVVFDRANQRIGFAPSNISHAEAGPCGMLNFSAHISICIFSSLFPIYFLW